MASKLPSLSQAKACLAELSDGSRLSSLAHVKACLAELPDGLQVVLLVPSKGLFSTATRT